MLVAAAQPAWALAPDAPAQPAVGPLNGAIVVLFSAPADGGSPITRYDATCTSSDGGVPGTAAGTGTATAINVPGLDNGKTYTCTVNATNADGIGPDSPASAAVVPNTTPDAPAQPSVSPISGGAVVSFTPPFDGGSPITGYDAACTSSDGGAPGAGSGTTSPVTVNGLDDGLTYTCTVTASNANGPGPASVPSAPFAFGVPGRPDPPTVQAGGGSVILTFSPPVSDGGSPIDSYVGRCTSSDGGAFGFDSAPGSPLTVTGLDNGFTYTCTVFAHNASGDGPESLPSAPVVAGAAPDAPAQPSAAPGNARVTVGFVAPFDHGTPINGYTVACTSSNGGTPGTVFGVVSPIAVTGLTNGRTYTCKVTASNVLGDGPSSPASAAVVPSSVPSRPAAPSVTSGNARLTVSFQAPANNGRPITSYRVRCSSTDGGGVRLATTTRSPVVLTSVVNGFRYSCTVYATNANGNGPTSAASGIVVPYANGFRMFAGDGGIFVFGDSRFYGSAAPYARSLVVGMASTRDNRGYWLVAQDGGVYAFGDAGFYGSMGNQHLNLPIVGITATPSGRGYWLVASDGGIFAFGDAPFYGSTGNIRLNKPIVGMTPTATGRGYWFVASDGGMFAYGDARFYGSAAGRSSAAIVGMTNTASGHGYWIANSAGQVFNFGDARAYSTHPIAGLRLPIAGIAPTPSHLGFWLVAGDGGLFNFGDAPYFGWSAPLTLRRAIRGISS